MPLFSIPLSGLTATSNALNVISNNLANLNTTGYKDQTVNFKDLFYQTLGTNGAGSQIQVGAGTSIDSVTSNFNDGNINSTGISSNAAISGNGFFIVQQGNNQNYTRAGDFIVGSNGALTTQNGASVMGYPAINGTVSTTQGLTPLTIPTGQVSPSTPTTQASVNVNLDASAAVGGTNAIWPAQVTIYDSLGMPHNLTFTFTKTATNQWSYTATVPAADVTGSNAVLTGTLAFNGSGQLTGATVGGAPSSTTTQPITISGLADGAAPLTFNWNLTNASGASQISQLSSASTTNSTFSDGYTTGTLQGYTIGSDGTIEGSFSNGQTQSLGQIALANFTNVQGLQLLGNNQFASTLASGTAVVGVAGTGGRGTIQGSALEGSNVDMATEFSNLIVAQRGFESNAKAVTAFDEVTQAVTALVR
jgi:flagellar hook protein FlgE